MDIAAPKITIPTDFCPDNTHATKLLLDLGNLLIRTQVDTLDYFRNIFILNLFNLFKTLKYVFRTTINRNQLRIICTCDLIWS